MAARRAPRRGQGDVQLFVVLRDDEERALGRRVGGPGRWPLAAPRCDPLESSEVLPQDRLLELLQGLARLDAELVGERSPRVLVGGERVSLTARAVEREHQLAAQALPEGVLRDEAFELRHELGVASQRQVCLDPSLDGDETKLLEANDRRLRERLVREVVERRPAPERQRFAQLDRR